MKVENSSSNGFANYFDLTFDDIDSEFERRWQDSQTTKSQIIEESFSRIQPDAGDTILQFIGGQPFRAKYAPVQPPGELRYISQEVAAQVASVAREGVEQFSLWEHESFQPSHALLQYWIDGLIFLNMEESEHKAAELPRLFTISTMRKEFGEQLFSALIEELRYLRSDSANSVNLITAQGEFIAVFELRLSNLFPVKPRELGQFMVLLTRELVSHIALNPIESSWGRLEVNDGSLWAHLSAKEPARYPIATKRIMDLQL